MLRSDTRIIQPCRNGVDRCDLPILILTEIRLHAMEDPQPSCRYGRRRFSCVDPAACRFASDELHIFIVYKVIKSSNSVGSASNTCQHRIRQPSFLFQHLCLDFPGNHRLKITHDSRERMRSHDGTQHIMSILDPACPLSHGLGNRILQRSRPGSDRMDLCT